MKIAYGLKAHSGWAALVALGRRDGELVVVDRRRVELVEVLFRDALVYAAKECGVKVVEVPEKTLTTYAEESLALPLSKISQMLSTLGKQTGPPWGKDQKDAALAAMIALK